ncbi:hypothetical protein GCM10010831_05770 [Psychroflexus salis]|uniref:Uncharacterized protein n=1 Tax=Psychroflexus salis TaxID=1526574 RepID=A0A917E5M8_9FLAO|nr:hypothetical protein GCM10010831_05770 [Psychroflexus salis]
MGLTLVGVSTSTLLTVVEGVDFFISCVDVDFGFDEFVVLTFRFVPHDANKNKSTNAIKVAFEN